MVKESVIESTACSKIWSLYKCSSLKIYGTHWPDRLFFSSKIFRLTFFIEFKTNKGKLSAGQKNTIIMLRKIGQNVAVCRSVEEALLVAKYLTGPGSEQYYECEASELLKKL